MMTSRRQFTPPSGAIGHNLKMPVSIVQVDAFTPTPYTGNPAAVCVLNAPRDEEWMAAIALEMNLSETAFVVPEADGDNGTVYQLRWFTPTVEIDLCGHATLASAHVLWQESYLSPDNAARFHTRSGLLTCTTSGGWIEMDFPATFVEPANAPAQLSEAIGAEFKFVGRSKFDYLIEVADEGTVRSLKPNHHLLRQLPVRGVIATSLAAPANADKYDFVSRFFAPGSGVDEDPVTGSAHCALAPFWSKRIGKPEMIGYQASPRGGIVKVRPVDARVFLSGQAVTVLRGELTAE
jgi:PhzF family phenazine biosynthesis protein